MNYLLKSLVWLLNGCPKTAVPPLVEVSTKKRAPCFADVRLVITKYRVWIYRGSPPEFLVSDRKCSAAELELHCSAQIKIRSGKYAWRTDQYYALPYYTERAECVGQELLCYLDSEHDTCGNRKGILFVYLQVSEAMHLGIQLKECWITDWRLSSEEEQEAEAHWAVETAEVSV